MYHQKPVLSTKNTKDATKCGGLMQFVVAEKSKVV